MRIYRLEGAWLPLLLLVAATVSDAQQYISQSCGHDDFRCDDGKCITRSQRCDKVVDCSREEDEKNCPCQDDEFRCANDGSCIEMRKRCDGVPHCQDQSDEQDCERPACPADKFECNPGSKVACATRCDQQVECSGGEDEEDCSDCSVVCNGRCIEASKICDKHQDCPDGADEQFCDNCDGPNDFRCKSNGECIRSDQRCNNVYECQDYSDEQDCNATMISHPLGCLDGQFQCTDGTCIQREFYCDGRPDCLDSSDEFYCKCTDSEFTCMSGECIPFSFYCDGKEDCSNGSDEDNCNEIPSEAPQTGAEGVPTDSPIGIDLNGGYGQNSGGQSGTPTPAERGGNKCPDPNDFMCSSGQCIPYVYYCDRTQDCADNSDETNCDYKSQSRNEYITTESNQIYGGQPIDAPGSGSNGDSGSDPYGQPDGNPSGSSYGQSGGNPSGPPYEQPSGSPSGPPYEQPSGNPSGSSYGQPSGPSYGQPGGNPSGSSYGQPGGNPSGPPYEQPGGNPSGPPYEQPGGNSAGSTYGQPSGSSYGQPGGSPSGSSYEQTGGVPTEHPYEQPGRNPSGFFYGQPGGNPSGSSYGQPGENPTEPPYEQPGGSPSGSSYGQPSGSPYWQPGGNGSPYGQPGSHPSESSYGQPGGNPSGSSYGQPSGSSYGQPGGNPSESSYGQSGGNPSGSSYGQPGGNGSPYGQPGSNPSESSYGQPGGNPSGSSYGQPGGNPSGSSYGQPGGNPSGSSYGQPSGSFYGQPGGIPSGSPNGQEESSGSSGSSGTQGQGSGIDSTGSRSYGGPLALDIQTDPKTQTARYALAGGDVVFQCRDVGLERAAVRWVREGGRPLRPGAIDRNGRLEMNRVSVQDSGVYVCQAPRFLGYPGSEVKVTLNVDPAPLTPKSPVDACNPYQATCANGQCIPKSAVCNGVIDCSDKSDEDNCYTNGMCEPNEFQCANHKCILKTWLCDADNDCGDMSDEQNCGPSPPGQGCLPVEFACASGDQCVLKSFHCDTIMDCFDKSDELGCASVHVVMPPKPSNLKLNPGDTMTLTCKAVGVPMPLISWRLNWGHVPEKCTSTSIDGEGTLLCPNMQPSDSGAYSCEALNHLGTTFAAPDAIVNVNKTVCPPGFFNSEARSPSECIRCFCFGESTECQSADLFTYNMPTPLGEGGTRMVGVKQMPSGDIQLEESSSIGDQYYYLPLRNGATVTKLETYTSRSSWSTAHPYLTLPETYNGNQLTSYGGHIMFLVKPHSLRPGPNDNMPTVIIKGKYGRLIHINNNLDDKDIFIEARLTPEYWQKPTARGLVPASREDIMMALDNIEMILIRADLNNAGVNISDFTMESAQHINMGLGAASLVEECMCPPGYEGLSCQKCASGYQREKSGNWLGRCVRASCPAGTFGDPASGFDCKPCPCPLTNRENQFSRTCSLGPDGSVICDCVTGYEGRTCEYCAPGYIGNPLVPGDSCRPAPSDNCNPVGTSQVRLPDECVCKDNVQGRYCDQCKNHSFFLSSDFRQGCAQCFCSGVSQECMSSNLRRKTTTVQFNVPTIVDQMKVYRSPLSGSASVVRYKAPQETEFRPEINRGRISLVDYDRSEPFIYYWSLPSSFSGDKVTSYGGYLRYLLENVPQGYGSGNNAPDVQLLSDNHLPFNYVGNFKPSSDGILNVTIQFLEGGWRRSDGKEVTREYFLMALSDVKSILIKATYAQNAPLATPSFASIETAEPNSNGPSAQHVELCVCPQGYVGTSCEDCAPGFSRTLSGLYLHHCAPCECNGHANMCHPETGICFDCADNTYGEHCEECKPGFERDAYMNCVPTYPLSTTYQPCRCDPRGEETPCDASGQCHCKVNVEGESCDRCRSGTFGLDANNPAGCIACYCSGVTNDCHQASHYARIPLPAPIFGDDYGGYTLIDLNAQKVISDRFVPVPDQSELLYNFNFPPTTELFWSLPVFPGNRILSYGGALSLRQEFRSNGASSTSDPGTDVILVGDDASLYWTNPNPLRSGEPMSYQVPLKENGWFILNTATPASRNAFMGVLKNLRRVLVRATVTEDLLSTSIADVAMDIASESYDSSLPSAATVEICMCPPGYTGTSCENCKYGYYMDRNYCVQCPCNGNDCQMDASGQIQCHCRTPNSEPDCSISGDKETTTTLRPNRPPPPTTTVTVTIASPTIKIQEVGSSVNFTCEAQSRISSTPLPITWTKVDGYLPRERSQIYNGILYITNLQMTDSGIYVCQTTDGVNTVQATATLKVPGNAMTMPTVTLNPAVNDYFEGDRIQFECIVKGNPTPVITWQRSSNRPLPANVETFDGMFIIEDAREEDSGEYRCIGSNTLGTVDRTAMVIVRPRVASPPRGRLTVQPTAPTVSEGQSTRVICTGTADIPAESIEWSRQDGDQFLQNVRSDNGVLNIEYAELNNQGLYVCQSSSVDVAPVSILLTVVPVGTPSPSEAPNVTVSSIRLKIPTGESQTIECSPHGYPRPLIKWSKFEGTFGPGTIQRDNTLIIRNAQDSDYGYYICDGNDASGSSLARVFVYVEIDRREPPKVVIWPKGEQAVTIGSQYQLDCRVNGIPTPDVTWARAGGRLISPYVHIQPHNILRFDKVDVNDEGEYICSASNVAGTASASSVLKVHSPPEITILPKPYLTPLRGDYISIDCRADGYPQPTVSIKSTVDHRVIVPPTLGVAVLSIPSVSERDEGAYTCTATSPAGTTEEQLFIQVDRGDGGFGEFDGGSGDDDVGVGYPTNPDEQPKKLTGFEGQSEITLICPVTEDFMPKWERGDGQALQRNAFQRDSVLSILNASKSDSGEYVCSWIDRRTGEIARTIITNLAIMNKLKITLEPVTQTVAPGESTQVECIVEGDDILDISWRPIDRPLSRRVVARYSTLIFNQIQVEDAGHYECVARNRLQNASKTAEVIVSDYGEQRDSSLVRIEQPRSQFRVGDNVDVLCKVRMRGVSAEWKKYGTSEYVHYNQYGDGALLQIQNVQEHDASVYRCIGTDSYGRTSYEDFKLELLPGSNVAYPENRGVQVAEYTAHLKDYASLPCIHDLEQPVFIEWKREFTHLPSDIGINQPTLRLDNVTEKDAGTYICTVSNSRVTKEARAILRVIGVVPQFDGNSWLSLPTIRDSYMQLDIEISFRPVDNNGLILYNSQNQGRSGDYLALLLVDGVPQFVLETGTGPIEVRGDRPLQLNVWHTIRISRTVSKVTMNVDNTGTFTVKAQERDILDLYQPLYLGGVPDINQLPSQLSRTSGFVGCVSMLILGHTEQNIMVDSLEKYQIRECDSCASNECSNGAICQEARTERGYVCLCATGFAGENCDRTGEACRADLCGDGKCRDTSDGYKCDCPATHYGKNCEIIQNIEYPAYTGSAYSAIGTLQSSRYLKMSMKVKAITPVTDGLIMYCAETTRGHGGFTSLGVHDGRIEFRFDLGDGSAPVVLISDVRLEPDVWTDIEIGRSAGRVSLQINRVHNYEGMLESNKGLKLDTLMYIGGVDDSITLNNKTGVTGGFSGCIRDVTLNQMAVDIVTSSIESVNVRDCSIYGTRGDIPGAPEPCSLCRNGGSCAANAEVCTCPAGYTGLYCESRMPLQVARSNPCAARPCVNGGTCRPDPSSYMDHTCDCPLGFAGANCQMELTLDENVKFQGNGYLELPARLLRYDRLDKEPAVIALAIRTSDDGVLLYQREATAALGKGDYILLRVERGHVILEWDFGSGMSTLGIENVYINDGERHNIIVTLYEDHQMSLTVDTTTKNGFTTGMSHIMNADSNIYIGGIPDRINVLRYPGLTGCLEQIELMSQLRGIDLGQVAVAGRNAQRCKKSNRV